MTTTLKCNYKLEDIDPMIDNLSRLQFRILSDLSCGMPMSRICESLGLDDQAIKGEMFAIIDNMEVEDMKVAIECYSMWIDDFQTNWQNDKETQ